MPPPDAVPSAAAGGGCPVRGGIATTLPFAAPTDEAGWEAYRGTAVLQLRAGWDAEPHIPLRYDGFCSGKPSFGAVVVTGLSIIAHRVKWTGSKWCHETEIEDVDYFEKTNVTRTVFPDLPDNDPSLPPTTSTVVVSPFFITLLVRTRSGHVHPLRPHKHAIAMAAEESALLHKWGTEAFCVHGMPRLRARTPSTANEWSQFVGVPVLSYSHGPSLCYADHLNDRPRFHVVDNQGALVEIGHNSHVHTKTAAWRFVLPGMNVAGDVHVASLPKSEWTDPNLPPLFAMPPSVGNRDNRFEFGMVPTFEHLVIRVQREFGFGGLLSRRTGANYTVLQCFGNFWWTPNAYLPPAARHWLMTLLVAVRRPSALKLPSLPVEMIDAILGWCRVGDMLAYPSALAAALANLQ